MLRALAYPHWLMIAGILLIAFGLVGLAFRRNRDTSASGEIEPEAKQDSNRATKKVDSSLPPEIRKPG
jgi:LPXTG-motif cell wall-anchored protein